MRPILWPANSSKFAIKFAATLQPFSLESVMIKDRVAPDFNTNTDLLQRWPDENLSKLFRELLAVYNKLYETRLNQSGKPALAIVEGYETICRWIQKLLINTSEPGDRDESLHAPEYIRVKSIASEVKKIYGADWLQSLASLLGMLMHFTTDNRGARLLVNRRRPRKAFSTYPNSPAVTRFVGDAIIAYLLKDPVPRICNRFGDAERYAERALRFRLLDPSMESGQLLLEVALATVRKVHFMHSHSSKEAQRLARALLEKLCRDCLWGIDRNRLASGTVSLLFSLVGAEFKSPQLAPAHLLTADTLEYFNRGELPEFDAVINNPPWGERLRLAERKQLRGQFSSLKHWSDTYVAFTEIAIRSLKPKGAFALILPSQVVAAQNTTRLREMFLSETVIDQIVLLPRSAFAEATVRGLILLGRAHTAAASAECRVMRYPLVKRLTDIGPATSFIIDYDELQQFGGKSWWPLLSEKETVELRAQTLPLELLADVASGVHLYRKGEGVPSQTADLVKRRPFTLTAPARGTVPAIQGRDVHEFQLGSPRQFIKFGKWLARIGRHETLRRSTRIFVRELCRRDGKMTAAIAVDGFIPLHGVLTVVPKMIDPHVLVAILNSKVAAEYVSRHTASFSKVDFQKITVSELRQMPIPLAALNPSFRSKMGLADATGIEIALCRKLATLSRALSRMAQSNSRAFQRISAEINEIVSTMYTLISGG